MPELIHYNYWEHADGKLLKSAFPKSFNLSPKAFNKKKDRYCFTVKESNDYFHVKADYFIGVDWLEENHSAITIAPKLNTRLVDIIAGESDDKETELDDEFRSLPEKGRDVFVDYFAVLNDCLTIDYLYEEIDNLAQINWTATEIPIRQEQDWISPLLIVKFLKVVRSIVRKGLKKGYYKTVQNINSKVKGKILIGQNIKENVVKNRFTNTVCQYEEFGVNTLDNRLLKKAFGFTISYLDFNKNLFGSNKTNFAEIITFCKPVFESVSNEIEVYEIKQFKANPFFKEYNEGIQLAKLILKRYAYNISNTSKEIVATPPYWIDMPKLFELYAYKFLKGRFLQANSLEYHVRTYGNELDYLINSNNTKMVVDAKYKPLYIYGKNHQDMRQVSGYARLDKVYTNLKIEGNDLIDCLIIYPDIENGYNEIEFNTINMKLQPIKGYRNIFKVGIKLPVKK